jgi:hypothetical protein
LRGERWPLSRAVGTGSKGCRLRIDRRQNLLGSHLEAITLITIDMDAVRPDVIVEDFAALHPNRVARQERDRWAEWLLDLESGTVP